MLNSLYGDESLITQMLKTRPKEIKLVVKVLHEVVNELKDEVHYLVWGLSPTS